MTSSSDLPSSQIQKQIDTLCESFKAAWESGRGPQLEDYLSRVSEEERPKLLEALLKIKIDLLEINNLSSDDHRLVQKYQLNIEMPELPESDVEVSETDNSASGFLIIEEDHPEQIDQFIIQEVLGEGGFGIVYQAFDTRLHRTVALKVPLRETLNVGENLQRFIREARIAAALHHAGICPIYKVESQGVLPYIVMKLIKGPTLAAMIKKKTDSDESMSILESIKILAKIGEAIEYAHYKGVVHRDLKPANIIWDQCQQAPVVTDFGLARFWQSTETGLTTTGRVMGTPAYMAPEQVRGNSNESPRSLDIYSLGVIFYELLTGSRPFTGNRFDVAIQKSLEDPPRPSLLRTEIAPPLDAICLKAIARNPQQRYQRVSDFLEALAKYVAAKVTTNPGEFFSENDKVDKFLLEERVADPEENDNHKSDITTEVSGSLTYYELLRVDPHEDDDQVIADAAEHQIALLHQSHLSDNPELVQRRTYEILEARTVLADAYLKREYQKRLIKTGPLSDQTTESDTRKFLRSITGWKFSLLIIAFCLLAGMAIIPIFTVINASNTNTVTKTDSGAGSVAGSDDLLSQFQLDTQWLAGKWKFENHQLDSLKQNEFASVRFPFAGTNQYELESTFELQAVTEKSRVMFSIPVDNSRCWIEFNQKGCVIHGIILHQKRTDFNIGNVTKTGIWNLTQNGQPKGTYDSVHHILNINLSDDDWRMSIPEESRTKVKIRVTKVEQQDHIAVSVDSHQMFDLILAPGHSLLNEIPDIWRGLARKGIVLCTGWEETGTQARFYSLQIRPDIENEETAIVETRPPVADDISSTLVDTLPSLDETVTLLPAQDLSQFVTYIRYGFGKDPEKLFSLKDGYLHIKPNKNIRLITKRIFKNYRLVAEYKNGFQLRTSEGGLEVNMCWSNIDHEKQPNLNFEQQKHGARWIKTDNTIQVQLFSPESRRSRFGNGVISMRNAEVVYLGKRITYGNALMPLITDTLSGKPEGEWNRLEVISNRGQLKVTLNGVTTFEGEVIYPTSGRISIHANEASPVFRKLVVYPVDSPERLKLHSQ